MMIGYEILLMLDPELPEDRQEEIVTRVREGIEGSGGSWGAHDVWGRRRLAYEIDHKAEGVTTCSPSTRSRRRWPRSPGC